MKKPIVDRSLTKDISKQEKKYDCQLNMRDISEFRFDGEFFSKYPNALDAEREKNNRAFKLMNLVVFYGIGAIIMIYAIFYLFIS